MHVTAIIAAGGSGRRLGAGVPKQLLEVAGKSLLERSVDAFRSHPSIDGVVVALPAALAAEPPRWLDGVTIVRGGEQRQDSVANAFAAIPANTDVVLVHDAARPFVTPDVISRAIAGAAAHGAAIAALPVTDTVKRVDCDESGAQVIVGTLPRDEIFLAQTPQAFRTSVLRAAIEAGRSSSAGAAAVPATDEAMLAERAGHHVHIVAGDPANVKITTATDLDAARGRAATPAALSRVGVGYDLHRLVEGRALVLGGVTIPAERGALGHSDADVICHAVTDAVLGAARAGDIGRHYPDTDPRWKDASSIALLRDAVALVRRQGWIVENADVVVILERPKIAPHREQIERQLAAALGVAVDRVSVKGKTNEGVDAVGRGEAIAAHAVCLLTAAP
ncbi:MAG TPA: 2-C-methyl-D-erythritol 4-phosphate cytidylyltransferase [Vicinamibacterales bacterium]|nr:2-C-methyl-D-erythritol 4-phosphate cytidylyltransferase [Vicinamibacterales bacterium]